MPPYRLAFYKPGHFHAALTLRDANPNGSMWRFIDGTWSTADIS